MREGKYCRSRQNKLHKARRQTRKLKSSKKILEVPGDTRRPSRVLAYETLRPASCYDRRRHRHSSPGGIKYYMRVDTSNAAIISAYSRHPSLDSREGAHSGGAASSRGVPRNMLPPRKAGAGYAVAMPNRNQAAKSSSASRV